MAPDMDMGKGAKDCVGSPLPPVFGDVALHGCCCLIRGARSLARKHTRYPLERSRKWQLVVSRRARTSLTIICCGANDCPLQVRLHDGWLYRDVLAFDPVLVLAPVHAGLPLLP